MATSKISKSILGDMIKTVKELQSKELVRDYRGFSEKDMVGGFHEISYPGKNDTRSVVYDKHIPGTEVIDTLLQGLQYNILLYDKGLIQAEYMFDKKNVIQERLVFMKKHNKIWSTSEIKEYEDQEGQEEDWFSAEEGVPIMLRIDYAPKEHVEGDHAATHLTISNHESCRIPIKGIVTFSEFIRFVLFHFYNIKLDIGPYRLSNEDTITELEQKMIHINWK